MGTGTLRNVTKGGERARKVLDLYNRRALPPFVAAPVLKDVLALPGGGWIWIRFKADNRGMTFVKSPVSSLDQSSRRLAAGSVVNARANG